MANEVISICPICYEKIACHGKACGFLIRKVCNLFISRKESFYLEDDPESRAISESAKFLESKGYVVTLDVGKDKVAVFPNVRSAFFLEDRAQYCWCHWDRDN